MSDQVPSQLDHVRACPTFATAITRHRDSYVKSEEISKLQKDLEQLLSDAESRLNWLHMENDNIDFTDKQGSSDSSDCPTLSPHPSPKGAGSRISGSKRGPGRPTNDRVKNIKLANRLFKNKVKKSEVEKAPPLISDAPHKFWQTLDAWCADITQEDISKLQSLLAPCENEDDFYKVPALGTHYSQQWAMDDMLDEQREGSEPHTRNSEISNITPVSHPKPDTPSSKRNNALGPLTEKLLSALVEENVYTKEEIKDVSHFDDIPSPDQASKSSWTAAHVEQRIREELIELGVLNNSDDESEDEVLSELISKQEELKELVEYNKTQLNLLYDTAIEYMKQQDIRQKIDILDDEVCDTYRNFMFKKHKKIPYTKKEKEQAGKLLSDRGKLYTQLQENAFLNT